MKNVKPENVQASSPLGSALSIDIQLMSPVQQTDKTLPHTRAGFQSLPPQFDLWIPVTRLVHYNLNKVTSLHSRASNARDAERLRSMLVPNVQLANPILPDANLDVNRRRWTRLHDNLTTPLDPKQAHQISQSI